MPTCSPPKLHNVIPDGVSGCKLDETNRHAGLLENLKVAWNCPKMLDMCNMINWGLDTSHVDGVHVQTYAHDSRNQVGKLANFASVYLLSFPLTLRPTWISSADVTAGRAPQHWHNFHIFWNGFVWIMEAMNPRFTNANSDVKARRFRHCSWWTSHKR